MTQLLGGPLDVLPVCAGTVGVGTASVTSSLAGKAGYTTFVTGFSVAWAAATAGTAVIQLQNLVGAQAHNYYINSGSAGLLSIEFTTPIPASVVNNAININWPATSTSTSVATSIHGFYA